MKKKNLLLIATFLITTHALAQSKLGIKLSPSFAFNRVYTEPNNAGFLSDRAAFKFRIGGIYDIPIRENYYVSIGLLFATKQLALKNEKLTIQEKDDTLAIKEQHALQYLQVPLLFKLYTSEIALDTSLYGTFGVVPEIKINNRLHKRTQDTPVIEKMHWWGLSGLVGLGIEYKLSLATSIFGGLSYQGSFFNTIKKQRIEDIPKLRCYNDLISLDLGIMLM